MAGSGQILVALDDETKEGALALAQNLATLVRGFKVGLPFVLDHGLGPLRELGSYGEVVCDFKTADIPHTDQLIVRRAFEAGAAGVIVHAFTGEDSLKACVDVGKEIGGEVYAVVAMTHPGAAGHLTPGMDQLIETALHAGVDGVVAPGNRPEVIRHVRSRVGQLSILAPGIGTQGGSAKEAKAAGADVLIVGRAITKAKNPRDAATHLLEELG